MIEKISNYFKDEYGKNVLLNYCFRFMAIFLSMFTVRVNIGYLGNNLYGLWLTIASIVSWMGSGDFGIANGLRNELAKAYGEGDKEKQEKLIATAVSTLSRVSIGLLIAIIIVCEVFVKAGILQTEVRIPMHITSVFFCVNLVLSISQSISNSYQKSWLITMTSFLMQLLSIVLVGFLDFANISANLCVFAVVQGLCTVFPNLLLIGILRKHGIYVFADVRKNYQGELTKSILGIGVQFFGLQICSIILYSTDNVIINYLFGSDQVTKYSIITKIYDSGNMLFSILLIALWSAVTYRLAQNDIEWIVHNVKKILEIWVVFVVGVIGVSVLFNYIIRIWLGVNAQYYEPGLIILFAAYCCITSFSAIFVNVLNGMGTIKLQLWIAIIGAAINIPLSVFFAKYCEMGIFGIKLATFIAAVLVAIFMPIQAVYLLRKKRNELQQNNKKDRALL